MARFDKIRYRYLYSNFTPHAEYYMYKFSAPYIPVQKHPHTCIAVRVDVEAREIHYAIARRESPGKLIALKNRIRQIRNLGGIVPEVMTRALNSYPHDFSKATARKVACLRLNNKPHVIAGVDIESLNAHTITRLVMEHIINDYEINHSAPTLEEYTAADAAAAWLQEHDLENRDTLPNLKVDPKFMANLERAAETLLGDLSRAILPALDDGDFDINAPFGIADGKPQAEPTFLPIMRKKDTR